MRGLAIGETSSPTDPVLQLFTRSGGLLTDPFEAEFLVQDIKDPDGSASSKVGATPLDLTLYEAGNLTGDKLGSGRFVLRFDTTGWAVGTHRAVCTYRMVDGGRQYKQVIPFEVLSTDDYATGQGFVAYCTTRDLYRVGTFVYSAMGPASLHMTLEAVSKEIEALTCRYFEPRYLTERLDGASLPVLFLNESIIAIDTIVRQPDNDETNQEPYDNTAVKVYNRHLDGLMNPDDRDNPKLILGADQVGPSYFSQFWADGKQNLLVTGVFGFTDPEPRSDRVLIGQTPRDFVQIAGTMMSRTLEDPTLSSPATHRPGTVRGYKTRDQQISFYGASGNVEYTGGFTGDALLDQKLLRFVKPARLVYPERPASLAALE